MISRLFKSKVAHNVGWIIGGRVAQMLINLIVGLLTARYLGPANYGLINYASAYTGFFAAFCTLGINSVMVKELIDNPEQEGKIIGTSILLRAISSLLSAIVIICIVSLMDKGDITTICVVSLSCIGMIFQIFELFNYWFQSRLQSKTTAIITFAAYVMTAAYKVYLLLAGKSVVWFALSTSVDYICIAVLLFVAYKKNGGRKLSINIATGKSIFSKSYHFILPSIMVAVYAQTDKIMLKQMIGAEEIGFYSTAASLCGVWCFVLSAIIDSLYPEIAKAYNVDKSLFKKRNRQLYAMVFYISMFVSVMFVVFGELAIRIMYGKAYLPAAEPLKIITWYTAFSYLGVARNAWVVCEGRQKYLKYVYASAAISNVILNIIFIPMWGAVGAAMASLSAQVITTMIAPFFIKGLRENSIMMLEAIRFKFD